MGNWPIRARALLLFCYIYVHDVYWLKCSCLGQRDVHVYVNKTKKKEKKKERKKVASVVVLSNNSCVILRQLYISRFYEGYCSIESRV